MGRAKDIATATLGATRRFLLPEADKTALRRIAWWNRFKRRAWRIATLLVIVALVILWIASTGCASRGTPEPASADPEAPSPPEPPDQLAEPEPAPTPPIAPADTGTEEPEPVPPPITDAEAVDALALLRAVAEGVDAGTLGVGDYALAVRLVRAYLALADRHATAQALLAELRGVLEGSAAREAGTAASTSAQHPASSSTPEDPDVAAVRGRADDAFRALRQELDP